MRRIFQAKMLSVWQPNRSALHVTACLDAAAGQCAEGLERLVDQRRHDLGRRRGFVKVRHRAHEATKVPGPIWFCACIVSTAQSAVNRTKPGS